MYCSKCASNLPDDAIVCDKCGASTSVPGLEAPPPKKSRGVGSVLLIIAAVCAALALALALVVVSFIIGVGIIGGKSAVRSGNETFAAQSIDKIRTFQVQYASRNRGNFATFDELVKGSLEEKFRGENPVVNGYRFSMRLEEKSRSRPGAYFLNADPVSDGTGTRHFYTDSSLGSIKMTDENRPAKAEDPAL